MNAKVIIVACATAWLVAACGGDDGGNLQSTCFEPFAPGVVIEMPAVDTSILDGHGHGLALGATVVGQDGQLILPVVQRDTVHAFIAGVIGNITVAVGKPFYRDTVIPNVVVRTDACGRVVTTKLNVTLALLPDAPSFRSVNIVGAFFLGEPGAKDTLRAYFDADPQVSRAVTWRISDTTIASLTPEGIVTDKCTLDGGTETVTVVPAADTTLQTSARFSVAPRTFCP